MRFSIILLLGLIGCDWSKNENNFPTDTETLHRSEVIISCPYVKPTPFPRIPFPKQKLEEPVPRVEPSPTPSSENGDTDEEDIDTAFAFLSLR
jgi:hypothetical protein